MKTLVLCGDLCDAKDNHPALLVNRVVAEIDETRKVVPQVVINQGNHDYLQRGHSFFEFVSRLDGVQFVVKPLEIVLDGGPTACFMPHTRTPAKDWRDLDFSHYDLLFIHQTVKGARSSNGQVLDGEDLPKLGAMKVWSGDIHVPQVVQEVEYIGSPYHVHFGDDFVPRVVLLDRRGRAHDLHPEGMPRRVAARVSSLRDLERVADSLHTGDQVKIRVALDSATRHEWPQLKRMAAELLDDVGITVAGVELQVEKSARRFGRHQARRTDAEVLADFVAAEGLPAEALEVGEDLMSRQV